MHYSRIIGLIAFCSFLLQTVLAQQSMAIKMANSFMHWYPDSIPVKADRPAAWDYEQGLMLKAIEKVWRTTADPTYFNYIKHDIDRYVSKAGTIRTYKAEDYNLDNISTGRSLLMLSQQSLQDREKYKLAADGLWQQLENQPKTQAGGYWHKKRYPNQIWLDGLFMAEPFSAEYSLLFNHPEHWDIILRQFDQVEAHMVDKTTGLIYHGYDESRDQAWANKTTGLSPHFWSRAIGWYAMALVEALDYIPSDHPGRPKLITYLKRLAPVLLKYQDPASGVWFQMIALGGKQGNYLEASASSMFTYVLLKGIRKGYLDPQYLPQAKIAYTGLLKQFVSVEADGTLSLDKTVSVGGLGGSPYRDGSYEYYLSEPIRKNDLKGVGPFIFAALEMDLLNERMVGEKKKIGLDNYFNHEFRTSQNGGQEPFHYTWTDQLHSGFYWFGKIFEDKGASLHQIVQAPSKSNLKEMDVYIIADPDDARETDHPNYIMPADVKVIKKWVKKGGTLLLMTNDSAHCELVHANDLAKAFGIQFTFESKNMVPGKEYEYGMIHIEQGNPVFPHTKTVYIKELVTLALAEPAKPVMTKEGDVLAAVSHYGKGKVFVVGDPWLYNEYVDGRMIPIQYQNYQAAKDLVDWLVKSK